MDNRGFGTGFSNWGRGNSSSRGSDNYGSHGYKDSLSGGGGFGGGYGSGGAGLMKRGFGGSSVASPTGTSADAVIAKINQRLDMLTQMEGGMKRGGRNDRFDQYESFDSRPSSLNPRDLYRSSNYGYSEGQRGGAGLGGGSFEGSSSFGSSKPQMARQPRDSYPGPTWAGQRSPGGRVRGQGGPGFGRWQEPALGGGPGSHFPGGRGKPPSLLSHHMYPEMGVYRQGPSPQDYPGAGHFGGGAWAGHQRGRKRPVNRAKPERDGRKRRKVEQDVEAGADKAEAEGAELGEAELADEGKEVIVKTEEPDTATEESATTEGDALTMQEEIAQVKKSLQGKQSPAQDKTPKQRKRNTRFPERSGVKLNAQRLMFACSVCKYRSFYSDEMDAHLESRFHKEQFKFLCGKLSKPTTDFLQEYLNDKYKKTELRRKHIDDLNAAICQVHKDQDLTRDLGMEHFLRKVEAAHCAACNLFIPMQQHLIQRHLRSPEHNFHRKGMMEQSKRASLSVARSILNHKVISRKLELYLKGENPFSSNPDEQDPDEHAADAPEAELANDGHDGEEHQGGDEAESERPAEGLEGGGGEEEGAEEAEGEELGQAAKEDSLIEGDGGGEEVAEVGDGIEEENGDDGEELITGAAV
ncbi:A-kinase anchor protein 8-like isoform X2 [Paramormyrops kingsleyae]|uniref:A-kinase anchor protein 8-like isoform X2 n=1 Tax=Paramormyrops kingsleyae TaxID=1676925 RepID=UPI000CD5FFFF|nr:A-kinase anchor protein 8-like isoform X2 [Paramormyrops kingsleyae]